MRHCRPLLLALALAASLPMTALAQSTPATTMATPGGTLLSVTARGEATRVPDIATISAGVVTRADDANAALRANAAEMDRVMAAVRKAGIAERDIRTSGINLHPDYQYAENQPPRITGYQASNTVQLKVRDIARLGSVLDALVASGANNIDGPAFAVDQEEAAQDEARRNALELARTRAAMYAESLGLRVRRIVSISEGGGFRMPVPMPAMAMRAMDAKLETQVAPGETTLSAQVDVVFELGE
jgi:uncharacterized protein YggE